MKFNIDRLSVVQLQWLVWTCVIFTVFFTTLSEDRLSQSIVYTALNTGFYAAIIYGNISFLYPRFYEKSKKAQYVGYAIAYIILLTLARSFTSIYIYNHFFATQPARLTSSILLAFLASATLDFILSLIFRIALAYFKLKQQSEEIMLQKSKAELKLLKSQVQPHFLFNTLNNIYYEAYTEAPRTASLIEKLSEIMRYLVDESSKDQVPLTAEINFIENYMALERIRVRYGVDITFEKKLAGDVMLPPMLLMTFVENIFKHGIDKLNDSNEIEIRLYEQNHYLFFETSNRKVDAADHVHGFGLKNLRDRLNLLYGTDYDLNFKDDDIKYSAYLKIPVT